MHDGTIKTRIDGHAAFITLHNPEKANAYTEQMLDQMENALHSMCDNPSVRVIVFEGSEGRFCSGADLDQLRSRGMDEALNLTSDRVFDKIDSCNKPTIAAIDGPAIAGGFELALACDLRIATTRARFALPETAIGILPAAGGLRRLPQLAGESITKQMVIFGRTLMANDALSIGLVAEITEPESLPEVIVKWVQAALDRNSNACKSAKKAIRMTRNDTAAKQFIANAQGVLYDLKRRNND